MKRMGLETGRRRKPASGDVRRFAHERRLQLVLGDFKHFRAGPTRARRVALYLLDDATRFGLGVRVATSERAEATLHLLAEVIRRYGRMDAVYFDRGPAFIAKDVTRVLAGLDIACIHGKARYPEAHGKIERFHRSVAERLLRTLSRQPTVDPDCGALTLRLGHDLTRVYNHLPHEGLGDETPQARWDGCDRGLRPVPDADLRSAFHLPLERRVSSDHVVSVDGVAHEVPRGLAGREITLWRAVLADELILFCRHRGKWIRIHPVDEALNARDARGRGEETPDEPTGPLPPSSSTLAFEADYPPMVDADGGYAEPLSDEDDPDESTDGPEHPDDPDSPETDPREES